MEKKLQKTKFIKKTCPNGFIGHHHYKIAATNDVTPGMLENTCISMEEYSRTFYMEAHDTAITAILERIKGICVFYYYIISLDKVRVLNAHYRLYAWYF